MSTLHFKDKEFVCRCGKCDSKKIDSHLLAVLELVRHHFDKPVIVTSGYRCPTHNKNVGGAPRSKHVEAIAADIKVKDVAPSAVYAFLDSVFPNSYGLASANSFTHIDVRSKKARWTY